MSRDGGCHWGVPRELGATHQPAAQDVEVISGEDGAGVGGKHLDAPRDLSRAWRGGQERGRGSQDLGRKGGKGVPPPCPAHIPPGATRKGSVYFLTMRSMVW